MTSDFLRASARYVFFAALAYAPWAYGGTTATSIQVINWLLLTTLLLWMAELLVNRRKPAFPRGLIFIIVGLLALGTWMVLNSSSIYDADFSAFAPLRKLVPHLAGSVDYAISAAWMIRGSLLLGVVLFVADFSQDSRWVLRLWVVIAAVAGSLAFLGLLQKATGAPMIFWQPAEGEPLETFFATYYYHGNAGAFLNLVLPLSAGLAVRSFATRSNPGVQGAWLSVFVLTLAAVFANTSRMAQAIAILLLVALAFQLGPKLMRRLLGTEKNIALGGAAAILLTLFALGQASHLEQPISRWEKLSEQIPADARWLAARVAIGALPDVGFLGFGPGTFRVIFPVYNNASSHTAPCGWRFLHEDYLQTVLEWGWFGSALWALLFLGGMATALRAVRSQSRGLRRQIRNLSEPEAFTSRRLKSEIPNRQISASQPFSVSAFQGQWSPRRGLILPLIVIALGSVALHALVDFPLQIASIQLYVATYLGLCWGSSGWKPEVRGQGSEDRGQRTEDRGQRTEDRGQRTEVREKQTSNVQPAYAKGFGVAGAHLSRRRSPRRPKEERSRSNCGLRNQ